MRHMVVEHGRVVGIQLANGERLNADAVVFNGDISALTARERPAPATAPRDRSLSAVTWCLSARTEGFDLAHQR
jgi:1-hydroxycarotenoid 3,4-desaturase